jgi:hypothetical protein
MAHTAVSKGFFIRKSRGEEIPPKIAAVYQCPENDQIFAKLRQIHEKTGYGISDLVYLYFNIHPFPVVSISSFSGQGQLVEAMAHTALENVDLSPLKELNRTKKYSF